MRMYASLYVHANKQKADTHSSDSETEIENSKIGIDNCNKTHVCMYIHAYACMYVQTCVCMYVRTHAGTCIRMYIYTL